MSAGWLASFPVLLRLFGWSLRFGVAAAAGSLLGVGVLVLGWWFVASCFPFFLAVPGFWLVFTGRTCYNGSVGLGF